MTDKKELTTETILPVLNSPEFIKRKKEAIARLTKGMTPLKEIKTRPGRGGTNQRYVDIAYMVEQANLLTTFNWKQEVVKEEEFKDGKGKIVEIGVLVKVTFYTPDGSAISKEQWGQKEVMYQKGTDTPVAYFDDKKAAISDGVKKCLSYFGIAADVYAGKELEFYMEDKDFLADMGNDQWQNVFNKLLKDNRMAYKDVFKVLNVKGLGEATDFKQAYETLKSYLAKEEEKGK
jgi:recombination DNA repair RAD52 pathway protein